MVIEWLHAFLLTEAIEVPIYSAALTGRPAFQRLLLAFLASLLTHPFVWIVVAHAGVEDYWWALSWSETLAVLVEGAYLSGLRARFPFAWSLLANASSLGVGLVIYSL